jgi:hypothetical protein
MTQMADHQKHIGDDDIDGLVAITCGTPRRAVKEAAGHEAGYGFGV